MKGDFVFIVVLLFLAGLLLEAVDAPVVLWTIRTISDWLRALPAPSEHFANLVVGMAWPLASLAIIWMLRGPLSSAADHLAKRFESDDVDLAGWVKLSAKTQVETLDKGTVTVSPNSPEAADAVIIEQLLEFAGESDQTAKCLKDWISANLSTTFDPEEFLFAKGLAVVRKKALVELMKDSPRV